MAELVPELQELLARVQQHGQAQLRERVRARPEDMLTLCLVPEWSHALLAALDLGDRVWLDGLVESGVVEMRSGAHDPEVPWSESSTRADHERFWVPESRRPHVLRELELYADAPAKRAAQVARRILEQADASAAAPPAVREWAQLARFVDEPATLIAELDQHTRRILEARRRANVRGQGRQSAHTGELFQLLAVARRLTWLTPLRVTSAIERSARQLQLHLRHKDEVRRIRGTLRRAELEAPLERLLAGDEPDVWALHYIGGGGAGKTVFANQLCAELVARRGGVTARVDFDHIDPAFPMRDPGRLLVALAEELQLHVEHGRAQSPMRRLLQASAGAAELSSDERQSSGATAQLLTSRAMRIAMQAFASLIDLLPAPVVLVLDTCEELDKVARRDLGQGPAVEATFALLREIRERTDDRLRVVFLGRRLLGDCGADWQRVGIEPDDPALCRRPELVLCPVLPWNRDDAERWLDLEADQSKAAHIARLREPSWRDALIDQARGEVPWAIDVTWRDDRHLQERTGRVSPFELVSHARWAADDETLRPEQLAGARDQYVALRIVGRLSPGVRMLLPAVAVLGRFDRELLRAVVERAGVPVTVDDAWPDLVANEWSTCDASGRHGVQPGWQRRLQDHLGEVAAGAMKTARDAVRAVLQTLPGARPDSADPWTVDRLLGLLDVEAGAGYWQEVEQHLEAAGDFARLAAVAEAVATGTCIDDDEVPSAHPLRMPVLAALAGAREQLDIDAFTGELWAEVLALASVDDTDKRGRFQQLARVGLRAMDDSWPPPERGDVQVYTARISLAEGLLYRWEVDSAGTPLTLQEALTSWAAAARADDLPTAVPLYLQVLDARARLLAGDDSGFALLDEVLGRVEADPPAHRWHLYWRAPVDLRARVRLEWLRHAWPARMDVAEVLARVDTWPESERFLGGNRDGDALIASIEEVQRAVRGGYRWGNADLQAYLDLFARKRDAPAAWWQTEPALVRHAVSAGTHDPGHSAVVMRLLQDLADESWARAGYLGLQRPAAAGQHRIARALRHRELPATGALLTGSVADVALHWCTQTLLGPIDSVRIPQVPEDRRHEWSHGVAQWELAIARWRASAFDGSQGVEALCIWASDYLDGPWIQLPMDADSSARHRTALRLGLIQLEALRLAERHGRTLSFQGFEPDAEAVRAWIEHHPEQPEACLELQLQGWVLELWSEPPAIERTVRRLGARKAAWVARELGELMALRAPADGARLLAWALEHFEACNDWMGAYTTRVALGCARAQAGSGDSLAPLLAALQQSRGNPLLVEALESDDMRGWRHRESALQALHDDGGRPGQACAALLERLGGPKALPAELRWLRARPTRPVDRGGPLPGMASPRPFPGIPSGAPAAKHPFAGMPASKGPSKRPVTPPRQTRSPFDDMPMPLEYAGAAEAARVIEEADQAEDALESAPSAPSVPVPPRSPVPPRGAIELRLSGVGREHLVEPGPTPFAVRWQLAGATGDLRVPELVDLQTLLHVSAHSRLAQELQERVGQETEPEIVLRIDDELYGLPWEALLAIPLDWRQGGSDWLRLAFTRVVVGSVESPPARLHRVALYTGGYSRFQRRLRGVFTRGLGETVDISYPDLIVPEGGHEQAHIVHIVGLPQESSRGLTLHLGDAEAPHQIQQSQSGYTRSMEAATIMSLEECAHIARTAQLLILQPPPAFELMRTPSERQELALLRLTAARLRRLGAPRVLTLPWLTERLSAVFLEPLVHFLAQAGRPGDETPLEAWIHRGLMRARESLLNDDRFDDLFNAIEVAHEASLTI